MHIELERYIPSADPDFIIGPLYFWIPGYTDPNQIGMSDQAYCDLYVLLNAAHFLVLSPRSEVPVFALKALLHDMTKMHEWVKQVIIVEFEPISEFSIQLTSDGCGDITLHIEYESWHDLGTIKHTHHIDQSYLPEIITQLKRIIKRFE